MQDISKTIQLCYKIAKTLTWYENSERVGYARPRDLLADCSSESDLLPRCLILGKFIQQKYSVLPFI